MRIINILWIPHDFLTEGDLRYRDKADELSS